MAAAVELAIGDEPACSFEGTTLRAGRRAVNGASWPLPPPRSTTHGQCCRPFVFGCVGIPTTPTCSRQTVHRSAPPRLGGPPAAWCDDCCGVAADSQTSDTLPTLVWCPRECTFYEFPASSAIGSKCAAVTRRRPDVFTCPKTTHADTPISRAAARDAPLPPISFGGRCAFVTVRTTPSP